MKQSKNTLRKARQAVPLLAAGAVIALGGEQAINVVKTPDKPVVPSVEYKPKQAIYTAFELHGDSRKSYIVSRPDKVKISEDGKGGLAVTSEPSGKPVEFDVHIDAPGTNNDVTTSDRPADIMHTQGRDRNGETVTGPDFQIGKPLDGLHIEQSVAPPEIPSSPNSRHP